MGCKKNIRPVGVDAVLNYNIPENCVLLTSNHIQPNVLSEHQYQSFPNTWYGIYSGDVPIEDTPPNFDYNCLINRMDVIRQSWFYQLVRRGLFDRGLISFNMDISRHISQNRYAKNVTAMEVFDHQFETQLKIFEKEHHQVRSMVPYRNFDQDLYQVIMNSKFSVILETYFHCNKSITLSEKTFRCLKMPRPWILFAMKGAVKYLRDMGFDVLDDLVDHSYDQIEFEIDRQVALLDLMEKLVQVDFTEKTFKRCKKAAEHNQALLKQLYARWYDDINQTYELVRQKCFTP